MSAIDEIVRLREEGQTLDSIGDIFGYTRERVRQVIVEYEAQAGRKVTPPPRETAAERAARHREERAARVERDRQEYAAAWIGQRLGSLTITELAHEAIRVGGQRLWRATVRCDCGVISKVDLRNMIRGDSRTCGSKGHGHKRGWYRRSAPSNVIHIPEGHP